MIVISLFFLASFSKGSAKYLSTNNEVGPGNNNPETEYHVGIKNPGEIPECPATSFFDIWC